MNDSFRDPDSTVDTLKRLAREAMETMEPTTGTSAVPELALWRVHSTRQSLIEKGSFSPEEVAALDQMAAAQVHLEAEQIAARTREHFVSGVRIEDKRTAKDSEEAP